MGLFEQLRRALGVEAEAAATQPADPEDLFGMSTAYVTMAGDLGFESAGVAALCFASVDSADFTDAGEAETGTATTGSSSATTT
ncbi:hypothetical protein SAMN05216218_12016 [Halorientalis regularis]|jgi:hypothetical protein|uniref:Uncharacterized protein n=1 Tax=Halorientalis regularis TaxID=660518 RepID=A0A1G7SSR0_9EURY|nr:hypothetical protein SAMN05216218_12016 [Halorientalis regularis]